MNQFSDEIFGLGGDGGRSYGIKEMGATQGYAGARPARADSSRGRLIKEKAKNDVEKIFSGFLKTRENLAVIDELLLFWNLAETDRVLDELEDALLVSDFGPKITVRIVERLR